MRMTMPPLLTRYLWRYPLRVGVVVTAILMVAVFTAFSIGGIVATATWNDTRRSLLDFLGHNDDPERPKPGSRFLYGECPMAVRVATATSVLYVITAVLLLYGVRYDFKSFIVLFVGNSVFVMMLALAGHLYLFLAFEWQDQTQFGISVAVNILWYICWIYSVIVVSSYYIEVSSVVRSVGGSALVEDEIRLPKPRELDISSLEDAKLSEINKR